MRSSKSQKNISIITDRKSNNDIIVQPQSCTNMPRSPTYVSNISHKNVTQQSQHQHRNGHQSQSASGKKHRRQRSTSVQSGGGEWANENTGEARKKQLDYLCLQKILNIIKKYLIEKQQKWNMQILTYSHLLKLLYLCRYIKYAAEEDYIATSESEELKKIYLLWLSISIRKYVNFRDFVTFVIIVENFQIEKSKIQALLHSFQAEIKAFSQSEGFCEGFYEEDPKYTFFVKKIQVKREGLYILDGQAIRTRFVQEFKMFRFNKLKNNGVIECVKVQAQDNQLLISKKSCQLAEQKRKKIEDKIRSKKPQVQNINLLDLLSYRQRDHAPKKITVPLNPAACQKKPQHYRRGEVKKQLQLLARPKAYFEQRREDQINYEKQQEQYTFHPKVHNYKNNGKEKIMSIRNADKVLVRMKEARKIKQDKQNILQKGWSNCNNANIKAGQQNRQFQKIKLTQNSQIPLLSSCQKQNIDSQKPTPTHTSFTPSPSCQLPPSSEEKPSKYETSKEHLKIPILFIDVNIEEGKKQRIIIYDNDKAENLAKEFGLKHKLSEETVHRLEGLLQQQMDTVLARIQEENQDQASFLY